ncbi:hypothetical protein [Hydrogenophaga sp.]|uniref:hypothetical protein n=1 Tax=Hydrogenophaga sp. TaxID=1904254 RepID=UPI00271C6182|nr:hypothetical protein [Hydrogenophaga sp.]MDO9435826.1 hypothetical protein [Hydrogenophaga sp.]
MDNGLWATWYDLDDQDRDTFLSWMHGSYLPYLQGLPGHAWVAHYRNVGTGPALATYHDIAGHAPGDQKIATGSQYVVLVGAASSHSFFHPYVMDRIEPDGQAREMLAKRRGMRTVIFAEEARVNGPAGHARLPGSTPAPAIQFGTYSIQSPEAELDLGCWYAQQRFPVMARMQGSVLTRKYLSSSGWAKHGIMYEFESLEARTRQFEEPEESKIVDPKEWTGRIVRTTLHTPGSPVVGERIWPPVE